MSTNAEIVLVQPVLGQSLAFLGQLTQWHPRVDVLVDPLGQSQLAQNAVFQLACGATNLGPYAAYQGGVLQTTAYPTRVIASDLAAGAPPALMGQALGVLSTAINIAIIGWDPQETFDPVQLTGQAANVIPSGSGPTSGVNFGTVNWRPTADVVTQANADPLAMNLVYQLWANSGTTPNIRALVGAGPVKNNNVAERLIHYEGGAFSLELDVYCPGQAPAGAVFGALLAQAPAGLPTGGAGPVIANVRSVTGNDTAGPTDYYLSVEISRASALTLLLTAGLPQGQQFEIKDANGFFTGGVNVLTIQPQGGETIDFSAKKIVTSPNPAGGVPGGSVLITKVGTNWEVG